MCQLNLENLFDCVNKNKRPEAIKLLFQSIHVVLNSVKQSFSPWLMLRKKFFFLFILCIGIKAVSWKMKNELNFPNHDMLIQTFSQSQYSFFGWKLLFEVGGFLGFWSSILWGDAHRFCLYKIDSYPTWCCLLRKGWGLLLKGQNLL